MSLDVQSCQGCARLWFPPRLMCPHCGATSLTTVALHTGILAQSTVVGGVTIGAIHCDSGPELVARMYGSPRIGDEIPIVDRTNHGLAVAAYVPPALTLRGHDDTD